MPHIDVTFPANSVTLMTRGGHCREGLILSSNGPRNSQQGAYMPSLQLVKDQVDKEIPEIAKWDPDLTNESSGS